MIDSLVSILGLAWSALFLSLWLILGLVHLNSLRTGIIMGASSGSWAIKRNDRPVRFWLSWLGMAIPLVLVPAIVLTGLFLRLLGK